MNNWKTLVKEIAKDAEKQGVSNYELAQKSKIHRSSIGRFFKFEMQPTLKAFAKMANALDIEINLNKKC